MRREHEEMSIFPHRDEFRAEQRSTVEVEGHRSKRIETLGGCLVALDAWLLRCSARFRRAVAAARDLALLDPGRTMSLTPRNQPFRGL